MFLYGTLKKKIAGKTDQVANWGHNGPRLIQGYTLNASMRKRLQYGVPICLGPVVARPAAPVPTVAATLSFHQINRE